MKYHLAPTTRYLQFTYGQLHHVDCGLHGADVDLWIHEQPSHLGYGPFRWADAAGCRLRLLYRQRRAWAGLQGDRSASGVTQYDYYANRRVRGRYGFTTATPRPSRRVCPTTSSATAPVSPTAPARPPITTTTKITMESFSEELHPDRTTEVYTWSPANSS